MISTKYDTTTVGGRVGEAIRAAGFPSLSAFAREAGKKPSEVSRWVNSAVRPPGRKSLALIASLTGASEKWLQFGGEPTTDMVSRGTVAETQARYGVGLRPSLKDKAAAFDAIVALVAATLSGDAAAASVERRMLSYLGYLETTRERDSPEERADTGT